MSKHLSIEDIRVGCEGLNLVDEALGAKVLYSSDEWFASADNLIKPGRGEFDPDAFTLNGKRFFRELCLLYFSYAEVAVLGKLMDGWETSRHAALNRGGSDFCIIQMGVPGRIESVDIDTNHFTGNFAEFASLEACCYPSDLAIHANHPTPWFQLLDSSVVQWEEILPKSSNLPFISEMLLKLNLFV